MSMQSATLGRFWFGPQSAKGTAATTLYGFRGQLIDVSPQQIMRNMGPLVGGSFLPGKSLKTGAYSGGAAVLPPVLDEYIGWLFYAFAGTVSSNPNTPVSGAHEHYFPSGPDETAPGKYLTARRSVPGTAALYEEMIDLVPTRILLTAAPGEYTTLRYEVMGREFTSPDGSGWPFTPKNETSVPIGCKGGVEIPDATEQTTMTGGTIEIVNVVPDIRRVMVIGSYWPLDFPVLTRNITVTLTYLWETSDFYKSIWYSGEAWTPVMYNSSLDFYIQSATNIVGSTPYELKIWGASVDWEVTPLRLAGGEHIECQLRGTLTDAPSGNDWYIKLRNGTASYTWPT